MPWAALRTQPLRRHNSRTFISISRVTLITILIICNAEPVFRYSDSSGHRASYTSYIGLFYTEWPIGAPAMVHFHPLDSHAAETDVFPPVFQVRVDKCVQMLAGVITSADGRSFKCALTGRKQPGYWALEYLRKSYMGAHGSRYLYTMMGGNVAEVDFLCARRFEEDSTFPDGTMQLHLPTTELRVYSTIFVPPKEQEILEYGLDCLPWSSLSWSIHRGMKDILVAYAKNTVDKHRHTLANMLRGFISSNHRLFEINGWSASFVRGTMPESAANTVLAGGGNSGDAIRVVADAVLLYTGKRFGEELDETTFWRQGRHSMTEGFTLTTDAMIALTKCIVLEWSIDLDYQMHDDLPLELLLG